MKMENLTLKDLSIEHDYYCSTSNFYSRDALLNYENFEDFLEDFGDADVDMNLVFRWDLKKYEDEEKYYLEIFQMKQRKGIFTPIEVKEFTEKDIPLFIQYLKPHIEKLKNIWQPFNF